MKDLDDTFSVQRKLLQELSTMIKCFINYLPIQIGKININYCMPKMLHMTDLYNFSLCIREMVFPETFCSWTTPAKPFKSRSSHLVKEQVKPVMGKLHSPLCAAKVWCLVFEAWPLIGLALSPILTSTSDLVLSCCLVHLLPPLFGYHMQPTWPKDYSS